MRYILNDEFCVIDEDEGTLVNISTVPVEISTTNERGTGIILFPRQHLGLDSNVYAARAPGKIGTAIVAVVGTGYSKNEEITDEDIQKIFGEEISSNNSKDDEKITDEDIERLFENGG